MIDLVTTDSVRAVLGVSAKELPDSVLASPIYSVRLREDMLDLHSQMVADFARVSVIDSPPSDEQRFLDLAQTYAAYNVAQQCLIALPMFAPLTIKDEKAELTRNTDSFRQLKEDIGAVLSLMRGRLLTSYAKINVDAPAPTAVDRVFSIAVGLGSDPVTVG